MKTLHLLLGLVLFLVLMAVGLGVLSMAFQGEEAWRELIAQLDGRRVEAILASLGLVFVVLLFALTALRLPDQSQYLAYDIEGGTVSISLKAVEKMTGKPVKAVHVIVQGVRLPAEQKNAAKEVLPA